MEMGARAGGLVLVMIVLSVFGAALSQSYSTLLLWARDDAERGAQTTVGRAAVMNGHYLAAASSLAVARSGL